MPFIGERSMTSPPSHDRVAGDVVAAAAHGDGRSCSRAKLDRGHARRRRRGSARSAPDACRSSRCGPGGRRRTPGRRARSPVRAAPTSALRRRGRREPSSCVPLLDLPRSRTTLLLEGGGTKEPPAGARVRRRRGERAAPKRDSWTWLCTPMKEAGRSSPRSVGDRLLHRDAGERTPSRRGTSTSSSGSNPYAR